MTTLLLYENNDSMMIRGQGALQNVQMKIKSVIFVRNQKCRQRSAYNIKF